MFVQRNMNSETDLRIPHYYRSSYHFTTLLVPEHNVRGINKVFNWRKLLQSHKSILLFEQ